MPREVEPGMEVISGCINQTGILTICTTKEFGESTVAKILDLVENASDKKGRTENFITRFARYYTPAVVFAALALAILPPFITGPVSYTHLIVYFQCIHNKINLILNLIAVNHCIFCMMVMPMPCLLYTSKLIPNRQFIIGRRFPHKSSPPSPSTSTWMKFLSPFHP